MACSKFEYVKQYESQDKLLPSTYVVVRIDGKGFTKFCNAHDFEKPNDIRGINLMNKAAEIIVQTFPEVWMAYGESDEYSFVLRKNSTLYNRRSEKIATTFASCFAAAYTMFFKDFFPGQELKAIPMFDGRCICYPNDQTVRDYFSWRQADCHINNLYNTCFWSLVLKDGKSEDETHKILKGTDSAAKNEMLFSKFGINYAKIEPIWRKGSVIIRLPRDIPEKENTAAVAEESKTEDVEPKVEEIGEAEAEVKGNKEKKGGKKKEYKEPKEPRKKWDIVFVHEDVIGDAFWEKYKESLLL